MGHRDKGSGFESEQIYIKTSAKLGDPSEKFWKWSDADTKIVSSNTCYVFWSHGKYSRKSGKETCAGAFATNIGFYSTVSEVPKTAFSAELESCRNGRKPLGGMCGRRMVGRKGQRQLGLVKKCRDWGVGVTDCHLSFTGMELPKWISFLRSGTTRPMGSLQPSRYTHYYSVFSGHPFPQDVPPLWQGFVPAALLDTESLFLGQGEGNSAQHHREEGTGREAKS